MVLFLSLQVHNTYLRTKYIKNNYKIAIFSIKLNIIIF